MKEKIIHRQICSFIKLQYPDVIFFSEPSGLKVSIGIAVQLKQLRSDSKLPDLFIAQKSKQGEYSGLFIEIKKEGTKIYNGKGNFYSEHLKSQSEMLQRLRKKGYKAEFGVGFYECIKLIKSYLSEYKQT